MRDLLGRDCRLKTLRNPCQVHLAVDDQEARHLRTQSTPLPMAVHLVDMLTLNPAVRALRLPQGYYGLPPHDLEVFPALINRIDLEAKISLQDLNYTALQEIT